MEIERKFLLISAPDFTQCRPMYVSRLRQGYVTRHEKGIIRIRDDAGSYTITVKGKGMLAREEFEITVDRDVSNLLFTMALGRIIEKTRYRVCGPEGLLHEIDVFEGALSGLVMMEVEFSSEESARSYTPALFSELIVREVTEEPAFTNSMLSLREPPT